MNNFASYSAQQLKDMPTRRELNEAATHFFQETRQSVYNLVRNNKRTTLDDKPFINIRSAIKTACEFPHLLKDSFELLMYIERYYAASHQSSEWLGLYVKLATVALNEWKKSGEHLALVQQAFMRVGIANIHHLKLQNAKNLLERAIDRALDEHSSAWIRAKLAYIEACMQDVGLEHSVTECKKLLVVVERLAVNPSNDADQKTAVQREQTALRCEIYTVLAGIYGHFGQYNESFNVAQYAFCIARQLDDGVRMIMCAGVMITYLMFLHGPTVYADQLMKFCKTLNVPIYGYFTIANFHLNIAATAYCKEDYQTAAENYKASMKMMANMDSKPSLAAIYLGYGQTSTRIGDHTYAEELLADAQTLYQELNRVPLELHTQWARGFNHHQAGKNEAALKHLEAALQRYREIDMDEKIRAKYIKALTQDIEKVRGSLG